MRGGYPTTRLNAASVGGLAGRITIGINAGTWATGGGSTTAGALVYVISAALLESCYVTFADTVVPGAAWHYCFLRGMPHHGQFRSSQLLSAQP